MRTTPFAAALALGTALGTFSFHASAQQAAPPPPPPPPSTSAQPATASGADVEAGTEQASINKALTAFAAVGYSYGFATAFGAGVRFQWTLVPKGFLKLPHGMHDDFGLEPGFDYFHAGYTTGVPGEFTASWDYNEFTPLVGAVWNFWFTEKLAVYPKIDVGYRIASWSESVNGTTVATAHADLLPVYFQGAVGLVYRVGPVALRAEAGWEVLRGGVAVNLF